MYSKFRELKSSKSMDSSSPVTPSSDNFTSANNNSDEVDVPGDVVCLMIHCHCMIIVMKNRVKFYYMDKWSIV